MTGEARMAVLARIAAALRDAPLAPEIPREYCGPGAVPADAATIDLFCERVADYRATVHRVAPADVEATLASLLTGTVAAPAGLPWQPEAVDVTIDDPPLSPAQLDQIDTVITGCAAAIAETGTIVLDGTGASGRRMLTLIPDHHVCIVQAEQILARVPDAIAALRPDRPLTFVSGPSATSDIELERVEGVHGPRILDVIVVNAPAAD